MTEAVKHSIRPADSDAIDEAAAILCAGGLVAFPTETVYGLGADATNDRAVAAIFEAKGRPHFNPLIVHLPDAASLEGIVEVDDRARDVAARFCPGPLSLVLPRAKASPVSLLCSAGLDSLAVRVPAHPVATQLLHRVGRPLAAPSANRSGQVSPTRACHVAESLGTRVALILDGGPCSIGLESTVLDLSGRVPVLLRPGAVTGKELESVVGRLREPKADGPHKSPGRLESHYAPRLPLRLNAKSVGHDEALLAFGPKPPSGAAVTLNLSPKADLSEAAANLFAYLRALDRPELSAIAAMRVPEEGLGVAINDRLTRAAAR